MTQKIVSYEASHIRMVQDFNARMAAAGSDWAFYETNVPDWIPHDSARSQNVWREYFVVIENDAEVRGGYCLKPQKFLLRGADIWISNFQGPVSEGLVNPRYSLLALSFMAHMQRLQPRLYAWAASERMIALLQTLRWRIFWTPFFFRVLKPGRFLRQASHLRSHRRTRILLDGFARSGLGALAFRLLQARWRRTGGVEVQVETVHRFGPWADDIWAAARAHYTLIAQRDAATLNDLMATPGWPNATILRISSGGQTVGWVAIRTNRMHGDARFGDMHVGSVIDALSLPGHERSVVGAATRALEDRDVDMIATNFSHPTWGAAFRSSGYIPLQNRRIFAVSPKLEQATEPVDEAFLAGVHLTPIDGDGPRGL